MTIFGSGKRKRARDPEFQRKPLTNGFYETKPKKRLGTMDIILVVVGIALTAFTIEMIRTFRATGMVPDTLITCVFATLGGECGVMGWIKTCKLRHEDRTWQKEDEAEMEVKAKEAEHVPDRNEQRTEDLELSQGPGPV